MGRPRARDFDLQPGQRRINGRIYFQPTSKRERDARRQRAMTIPEGPLVYFVRAKNGPVKVGITTKAGLERRLVTMRTNSPVPLRLLGAVTGTKDDEKRAHAALWAYRRGGEWFGPSRAVTAFVRQALIDGRIPELSKFSGIAKNALGALDESTA
jgi:hypothetical protein